jgi:cAMP phosphodiesterase
MLKLKTAALHALVVAGFISCAAHAKDNKWQVEIEGQPPLSGTLVMPSKMGSLTTFNLIGANAMVSFGVKGDAPAEPYSAQVLYLDTKLACHRGVGDVQTDEVQLSHERDRIVVSGNIGCRQGDGEVVMHPIAGWFSK